MKTLKDIRDQVKADLDLDEETFVDDTDLNRWINDAIGLAEAEIHTLYQDYFLAELSGVPAIAGTALYDYPTDIYANMVRKIVYRQGAGGNTSTHEVRRVRNLLEAKEQDLYAINSVTSILQWSPINDSTVGRKIRIFPASSRDGFFDIFYIRNAKRLSLDDDICDIDEFELYIIQHAKTEAYIKDGDPRSSESFGLETNYKNIMTLTLADMVPDNNNEIEMDTSHYEDSQGSGYYDDGYYNGY